MLGAPSVTFLAFQEISIRAYKIMAEEQEREEARKAAQSVKPGMVRRWQPKRSVEETERLERENPFA